MDEPGQTGNGPLTTAEQSGGAAAIVVLSQQQQSVYELLRGLASGKDCFHEWYHGAIRTLESKLPDCLAQCAHSLRELCDRLPGSIGIPQFKSPLPHVQALASKLSEVKENAYKDGWIGREIDKPLSDLLVQFENTYRLFKAPPRTARLGLALTAGDPYAEILSREQRKFRDRVFKNIGEFFQNVAHHNYVPTDLEFRRRISLFESLLLNYLTPCTALQQSEILRLIAEGPNEVSLTRIEDLIFHKGANFAFFFERLDNPAWLQALEQRNYFGDLPEPERVDDGRVTYRPHAPLVALMRLAGTNPGAVTQILSKLKVPDNPVVEDQILRCMAAIKDRSCVSALCPLATNLGGRPNRATGIFINELLKSWVGLGAIREALAVARAYLMATVQTQNTLPGSESWLFREVNQAVFQALTSQCALDMAQILFHALRVRTKAQQTGDKRLLDEFAAAFGEKDADDSDDSDYWLEDFQQVPDGYRDLELTLASRLYDAAKRVYSLADRQRIDELDQLLRSETTMLFCRLRWQLYSDFPELSLEETRRDVLKRIPKLSRAAHGHNYEFAQMLAAHAKAHGNDFLSPNEVVNFFETVSRGPTDRSGKLMDDQYQNVFRRKQLLPIAGLLRGQQLAAYESLAAGGEGIDLESYKPFRSGGDAIWIQDVAPKEAEMLPSMSLPQVWLLLNEWQPRADYTRFETGIQEDYDELAARFAQLVEDHSGRFLPADKWWQNLRRPAALYKLLDRAVARIERKPGEENKKIQAPTENDWANWFGVAEWIAVQRPILQIRDTGPDAAIRSLDRDWTWARIVVARFLQVAVSTGVPTLESYTDKISGLIRNLVETKDPRLESKQAEEFYDWLTVAINSVRGRGIEVLLELALQQKRAAEQIEPWIFELIRSRVEDPEESPAVFALLGAKLRLLHYLFGSELKGIQDRFFPLTRPQARAAAIVAHFKYDRPMTQILESYPGLIEAALQILQQITAKLGELKPRDWEDFGTQLGLHIAFYYWNGAFKNDADGESALDHFFGIAPKEMRARLISTIGSVFQKESEHTARLAPRLMRIWERRFTAISEGVRSAEASVVEYEGELAESTDWLRCECFPFPWRFDYVMKAVTLLKHSPRSYYLLDSIAELAKQPERLNYVLQILLALLSKPSDELRWSIQPQELRPILALGFASTDASTRLLAERVRDSLLKLGFFDFLETGK